MRANLLAPQAAVGKALGNVLGVLEASWVLGESWALLEHLGSSWRHLGGIFGSLGELFARLVGFLEAFWGVLGVSWSILKASCRLRGNSWESLGPPWGHPRGFPGENVLLK